MYYIKSIRPFNLVIVALTQLLLYYIVILPSLEYAEVTNLLNPFLLIFLVIDTMLIAASGYVINDVIDEESDQINNKLKEGFVSEKAQIWYVFLVILSMLIALFIAYKIDNLALFMLNPFAILLLFLYSKYFKKMALLGNIVVALFCAFVPGILWFAERKAYQSYLDSDVFDLLTHNLGGFMAFGFMATMYREIVKDIEDINGDKLANYRTLPVEWGLERAKIAALFFGFLFLLLEFVWCNATAKDVHVTLTVIFIGIVILPTIYTLRKLFKANVSTDFGHISKSIKGIMLTGLIYLLVLFFYEFSDKI